LIFIARLLNNLLVQVEAMRYAFAQSSSAFTIAEYGQRVAKSRLHQSALATGLL